MEWRTLEESSCINAVVEEDNQSSAPIVTDRELLLPPTWSFQLKRGEVERVEISLGQIVATCYVALRFGFWESRKMLNQVLFPCPRQNRT